MFDLESEFSPLLSDSAHMKTMCWIFGPFLSPAWMLELSQLFYHKTFSFGKDEMCLPLMLLWFQWLLWIKAHLIAHWVCKPPEVCPPKELTISYYSLNIKHTMTLTARDYTSSVCKELWLLKMEEILVEFTHNCFSLQLVCSRPYFPLC